MMRLWAAALLLALFGARQEEIPFERDVVYGKGADEELKLNLSYPKEGTGPFPCVLVIHGGGWRSGRKESHDGLIRKFAQKGYVAATPGYRFAPKHPFPAQVEDVKCAVRFLRANAGKYKIDPARVGAMGFSAGAHLSMMLGVMGKGDGLEGEGGSAGQSSQVQAVVSYFGPTDFVTIEYPEASRKLVTEFLGGGPKEKAEAYRLASPVTYVTRGDPPMLLFQGTKDNLVPHSQAETMGEKLKAAGVEAKVDLFEGAGHGWSGPLKTKTDEATYAFFEQHLKPKK